MRKAKVLSCILAVSLIAASLGACAKEEGGEVSVLQNPKGSMAKVVSLDGDQITLILADAPEQNGDPSEEVSSATTTAVRTSLLVADDSTAAPSAPPEGQPPEGQPPQGGGPGGGGPGGMPPEDGATPPEGGKTPPEAGQAPTSGAAVNGGQDGGKLQFSGEEVTFLLSTNLKVIKGNDKEDTEIDLSEIKEGSIIMFTTATDEEGNEVIDSIRVLE